MRVSLRSSPRPGGGGHHQVLFVLAECVPFVIALLVLVMEFTPAHVLYTGPFLVATPALAAVTMGPRGTVAAAALAVAVSIATATYNQAWGDQQVYSNFLALFLVSLASVATSRMARARSATELNQVRRIASAAQKVLLRPVPERLGPLRAASLYVAAEKGAQIGGDLYEAMETRYGVRLIVGDVRGKGLPAVRTAAAVLGAFREAVHYEDDLVDVVRHCEEAMRRDAAVPGAVDEEALAEGFVTAVVAQVPPGHVVEVVNRGHPPPLLLRDGRVQALMPGSPLPPLGLGEFIAGPPGTREGYAFLPGDRLLLHTDGVNEARDPGNTFFALPEAMEAMPGLGPREFLDRLCRALVRHTGDRLDDDVAMIVVDRAGDDRGQAP
ncbi:MULTISPECIES: PP2C family protein-serine/threonine phosphatase [unclassified Streptomyces]|uniref:PP2C family protein-serine/threonine phosphatase n=1 Tax=Streptomyces sp. NRRL F-4428 TaxID=1609137 RepID=UPI0005EC6F72|nr:PP2C family protein-serine/threonine phosphatase [Streptomyces sp. NRRL F-4428]KJK53561.1 serine/threonine protein phosphatase [Streptomyces sp. NRRL F-4428]